VLFFQLLIAGGALISQSTPEHSFQAYFYCFVMCTKTAIL